MKIYANNISDTDLRDYVGEDIWVKVKSDDLKPNHPGNYIRILSINSNGVMTYNKIPARLVNGLAISSRTLGILLNERRTGYIGDFYVDTPIDTLTTAELTDIFENNQEVAL